MIIEAEINSTVRWLAGMVQVELCSVLFFMFLPKFSF